MTTFPNTPLTRLTTPTASPIHAITFSSGTGQYLLTGSQDRTIRLYNTSTSTSSSTSSSSSPKVIQTYSAHAHPILDLAVSADNSRLASVGGDKTVFVWDVATATTVRRFVGHAGAVNGVLFAGEGDGVVVSGSFDGTVRVWDLRAGGGAGGQGGGGKAVVVLGEARDSVSCVAVLGREIYAGSVDGRVRIYDVAMGEVDCDVVAPGTGVTSVVPTRKGDGYLVSSLGSVVRLMDRASGRCLQTFRDEGFKSEEYRVRSTLAMADGVALSGSENGQVVAWDVLSGEVVDRMWHTEGGATGANGSTTNKKSVVSAVAWNQARKQWASAGGDGTVVVWGTGT